MTATPTLLLVDNEGSLITEDGVGILNRDDDGSQFPWKQFVCRVKNEKAPRLKEEDTKFVHSSNLW